jgi:DNA-directed RNA polymerase specialized sigma24 family protein
VSTEDEERRAALSERIGALLFDPGELSRVELQRLLDSACNYLQATAPELTRDEAIEVVDGAVLELLELEANGRLDPRRDPSGLFLTIVHRRGVDFRRRARRAELPLADDEQGPAAAGGEDELIDALAGKERLEQLMGELAHQERHELVAVLRVSLDLEHRGTPATAAEVARRLEIDRSVVSRRLAEIRRLVAGENS